MEVLYSDDEGRAKALDLGNTPVNLYPHGPEGIIVTVRPGPDGKVSVELNMLSTTLAGHRLTIPALQHGSQRLEVTAVLTPEG